MGIISRITSFFKTPFKSNLIRDFTRRFSFYSRDLATNETIFSAVTMLSNGVASAPVSVQKNYVKLKPDEHNLARLFKYGPNPRMSMFNFIRTMEVQRNTKGAAYAIKEYGYIDEIKALWVLNSDYITPIIEKDSNELYYEIRECGEPRFVHNSHIVAVTHLTTDGYTPISPLDVLRNTIDYDREIKEFSLNQMQNRLKANLVVKIQTKLDQKALDEYNEMMKNMMKNGVIYVDSGKEFQELKNTSYIDPNVAAVEQITIERVERVYNMIGKLTKGSSTNSGATDTEDLLYLKDAILPIVRMYEQELTIKLIPEYERDSEGVEVKLSMNGFGRATMAIRGEFYFKAIRSSWLCADEIRAWEDQPPLPDGQGQVFYVSRDLCPIDRIGDLISSGSNTDVTKTPINQ